MQVVLALDPGGTQRLVVELTTRLRGSLPMAVCCLDEEGTWAAQLTAAGIPVHALGRTPGFNPALGRAIADFAAQQGASIVHCHHYSPFVYGCLARLWRPGMRVIFTEHGRLSDAPPSPKRRFVNAVLARVPHRVFAVSNDLKQHLVAEGFSTHAVDVIHNGIDPGVLPTARERAEMRHRLSVTDDTLVLGTIARLDPVKDLSTLIRATASLSRLTDVVLAIVGDGEERTRLESLAHELDAGASIRFLGHRNDARHWLAGCDLYVNSSISEGVSLTILEAMAAGLPVIATNVGGTPEVVDETCGRLIPAGDPDVLARTILELADQTGVRRTLGCAARRRVEERFSVQRMVDEYHDVYWAVA